MNSGMVIYMLGYVCYFEAVFLTLPVIVAIIYREAEGYAFFAVMLLCLVLGSLITRKKPKRQAMYSREGLVIVALSWIVLSVLGALPYLLSGDIPNVVNALFETVSGFTTTGASILPDVEVLSKTSLFWRSFTHWIGGMGVLVFMLAILPAQAGAAGTHIMRAESTGPSVSKLVPKIRQTAKILYAIYLSMTVIAMVIFFIGGMPLFDAVTIAFSTAGTGGFAIRNSSMAEYSPFLQTAVAVFLFLFGISFQLYYLAFTKRIRQALRSTELRVYVIIVIVATTIISISIVPFFGTGSSAFQHGFFQVASIITGTGYATFDYNTWPEICRTILMVLMFCGACAGSTSGGIKLSRLIILAKEIRSELGQLCHPRSIRKVWLDGRVIPPDVIRSIHVYLSIYVGVFAVSLLILSLDGRDMITNITAIAANLNNVGPGFEVVGPTGNYENFTTLAKSVFMFDMIAGRLELIPILMLFTPRNWRR